MKHFYPAIFCPKGYELEFPDIEGCFTMGNDIDERKRQSNLCADEKDYPTST